MKPRLLDTNVLIRFLVGDNKEQQEQSFDWFKDAQKGKIKIIITTIVIAEACFVLESFYKISKNKIAEKMELIISQRWISVQDKSTLAKTLSHYKNGLHFVDGFLMALAKEHNADILTFDKKIRKLA